MTKHLVINDKSLPIDSIEDCYQLVPNFFSMVHYAHLNKLNFFIADDTVSDWNQLNFSQDFKLGKFLNDIDNENIKLQIKAVLSSVKCPDLTNINIKLGEKLKSLMFYLANDESIEVNALGAASLIDGSGMSFPTHIHWFESEVPVRKHWEEDGGLTSTDILVPNICNMEQLEAAIQRLNTLRQQSRKYLQSLVVENNDDFPNLIFCESALKNFTSSIVTADDYDKIIHSLNSLNKAILVSNSLDDLILNSGLTISGESPETMQQRKLVRQREFKLPHGGYAVFEIHVKNFPDRKRLHILPDYVNKTICIGYFGPHLPTFRYP